MLLKKIKLSVACLLAVLLCGLGGGLATGWLGAVEGDHPVHAAALATDEAAPVVPEQAPKQDADAAIKFAMLRTKSQNNLKMIALALHSYHDVNNQLPMPAVYDKSGKPLLSWRVAILPYLDQDNLYRQFRFDEPWDSPHHKKILEEMPMPAVFAAGESAKNATYYQAIVGKDTAFEPRKMLRILDIVDGTSNTLGIVEAARAVPWTKPEDLAYVPGQALPALGGVLGGDWNGCMMDGSVRLFPKNIPEALLRTLITRNGGEPVDYNQIPPNRPIGVSPVNAKEVLQVNESLKETLEATQAQLNKEKVEILRLKAALEGDVKLDATTLKLLAQNAALQEALDRAMNELETLCIERARLEAQIQKKPKN